MIPAGTGLLICVPTGSREGIAPQLVNPLLLATRHRDGVTVMLTLPGSSLLTCNFNRGWALARTLRDQGKVTHFLLWHSDIVPTQKDWLERLFGALQASGCPVVSAMSPIKGTNLTSTAKDTDPWEPYRYSLSEMLALPETWSAPDLLLNTGLMLIDVRAFPMEETIFTIRDAIRWHAPTQEYVAYVEPEDWHFSRQCHRLGVPLAVTRSVTLHHLGTLAFPNGGADD